MHVLPACVYCPQEMSGGGSMVTLSSLADVENSESEAMQVRNQVQGRGTAIFDF